MFTPMFALGRLPGWIAQWREMRLRKEPIGRPRQVYIGETYREFIPVKKDKLIVFFIKHLLTMVLFLYLLYDKLAYH